MNRITSDKDIKQIVDDWVFNMAEQYTKASPKLKIQIARSSNDEEWSVLADKLKKTFKKHGWEQTTLVTNLVCDHVSGTEDMWPEVARVK